MENMIKDRKIPLPNAFIKLGQSQYMEKYIMNGELRFSPAKVFTKMDEGKNKIADTHEGSLYYQISRACEKKSVNLKPSVVEYN